MAMPEKIYAGSKAAVGAPLTGDWHPVETPSTPTEFIRADLGDELVKALETLRDYGCPVCHGDCGSANPPVNSCPMQMAEAALTRVKGDGK